MEHFPNKFQKAFREEFSNKLLKKSVRKTAEILKDVSGGSSSENSRRIYEEIFEGIS